jgi:N-acetylneuraminic acid mutarotase
MIRSKIHRYKMTRTLLMSGLLMIGLLPNTAIKAFAAAGSFALTGSLNTARFGHTATLLPNGDVLVTGGLGVNGIYSPLASAELFNPAKGKWTVTGSMSVGRAFFTATSLPNGEVLVTGGTGYTAYCFATAELYNPSTGQWKTTGSMTQPRCYHTATLLPTGEVVVAGGADSAVNTPNTMASAELYNPSTGIWQTTGSLNVSRASQVALLESGQAFVAGGYNTSNTTTTGLTSVELYEPSTGKWTLTASMTALFGPTTPVLLTNNDVLIASEVEFYNPATAAWTSTGPLPIPKTAGPPSLATLLNTGNVLASGTRCTYSGCGGAATTICFLYAFSSNTWSVAGDMNQARLSHTSTLLPNGQVLVAGGYAHVASEPIVLSSAELYTQ